MEKKKVSSLPLAESLLDDAQLVVNQQHTGTLKTVRVALAVFMSRVTASVNTAVSAAIAALTKSSVGLGNVDNTADLSKPISSAVADALLGKADSAHTHSSATTGAAGFMSPTDKVKLDGLSNYTLPAPTPTGLGGVKRNAGTTGQFVTGIAADGSLERGTPATGGGGSIATPSVLHVSSNGSDTTGDGSLANPYLTAQKAFDVAFAASGANRVIRLGVGVFSVHAANGWPSRIRVTGCGPWHTFMTLLSNDNVVLSSDLSVFFTSITATPTPPGDSAGYIWLRNVIGQDVTSQGADGQGGEQGYPGDGSNPGGNGGDGGTGGNGGEIRLIGCEFANLSSFPGNGGPGGEPGLDAGAGTGSSGNTGSPGMPGDIYLEGCLIGAITNCGLYNFSRTTLTTINAGSVGSDYGGNSPAPIPFTPS